MARPGGARRRGCPTNRETGPWRAAAFAGADWGRGTWICVLSKRRPTWLPSAGATPQTSATKRSDFHRAQPEKIRFKKNLNFRRHMNRYQETRQDRSNFFSGAKRSLTGASWGPPVHRETTWTQTQTYSPSPPSPLSSASGWPSPNRDMLAGRCSNVPMRMRAMTASWSASPSIAS